jgi:DNA-binding ferritin-like protein (Dps family)
MKFIEYFNIKKMIDEKKRYKEAMQRVKNFPKEYRIVYRGVEKYMYNFAGGDGMDTQEALYTLIDFFEEGIENQVPSLDLVGGDVVEFAEKLHKENELKGWRENIQNKINKEVHKELDKL